VTDDADDLGVNQFLGNDRAGLRVGLIILTGMSRWRRQNHDSAPFPETENRRSAGSFFASSPISG
jgi:hypothetical protein